MDCEGGIMQKDKKSLGIPKVVDIWVREPEGWRADVINFRECIVSVEGELRWGS